MTKSNGTHFHAGTNAPGYLPDDLPAVFGSWDDAKAYVIQELLSDADSAASWNEPHDCDDVPCPTFGDDCAEGKASDLTFAAEDLNLENGPDWSSIVAGRSYWIHSCGCEPGEAELAEEEEAEELTAWQLANMADCLSPDSLTSPGAGWLQRVARDAVELLEDQADDLTDGIAELADSSVPVYTHELWQVFVELGGYQEDVSELLGSERDLTKCASVALYLIAERLLTALVQDSARAA